MAQRESAAPAAPFPHLRILLLSTYYWPEVSGNAPYVTGIAEYLAAHGHDVDVLAGFPHYPDWRPLARRRIWQRERRNGVTIHRRWHTVPRSQSAVTRAGYEASALVAAASALPRRRRPDVVLAVSPTLAGAVVARAAARLYRRPYGIVFQDLLGKAATQSGVAGGGCVAGLVQSLEARAARGAALVGVVSDAFADGVAAMGVPRDRIIRLNNWSRVTAPAGVAREDARRRLGWPEDAFVCLHAGNVGHKQGLDVVVDAATLAGDRIEFVIAGNGNERPRLELLSRASGAPVRFVPSLSDSDYALALHAADVLLLVQRPTVMDMSLPSKLAAYLIAGRPIVGSVGSESEAAKELARAGAGIIVGPGSARALVDGVDRIRRDPALASALSNAGPNYATRLTPGAVLPTWHAFVLRLAHSDSTSRPLAPILGAAA